MGSNQWSQRTANVFFFGVCQSFFQWLSCLDQCFFKVSLPVILIAKDKEALCLGQRQRSQSLVQSCISMFGLLQNYTHYDHIIDGFMLQKIHLHRLAFQTFKGLYQSSWLIWYIIWFQRKKHWQLTGIGSWKVVSRIMISAWWVNKA